MSYEYADSSSDEWDYDSYAEQDGDAARASIPAADENAFIPEIDPTEIEFDEKIGEGSYGQVFSGSCRGKTVAIKVFKPGMFQTEEERQAIREEVRIMSKIYHPNVVLFMGACTLEGNNLMIVTDKMPTDLETLLIRDRAPVSLFQRILMCKDAALGMNWLHQSNPVFIHRDLKLSNLLVDDSYKVYVCDFGLAQMKPKEVHNLEYDPHGSPLYMAPEVFVGDYNEKCDIYSFGIVLWEIYTRTQAFEQVSDNLPAFIHAVCDDNFRPDIPSDTPKRLKKMMAECWQKDCQARPSFQQIIPRLDEIAVDVAIHDKEGRKLWKTKFLGRVEVYWDEFFASFMKQLHIVDVPVGSIEYKCLEAVLAQEPKKLLERQKVVNIERFGQVCAWFGPLKLLDDNKAMLNKLVSTLKERWFFGDLSQNQAEDRLNDQPKGTFLIRFSSSSPGCFTISHLNKKNQLCHQRVNHVPGSGFQFWETSFESLKALIRDQRKKQFFVQPCPGSSFQKLFPKKKKSSKTPAQPPGGVYMVTKPT